jgi:hypothetical protein
VPGVSTSPLFPSGNSAPRLEAVNPYERRRAILADPNSPNEFLRDIKVPSGLRTARGLREFLINSPKRDTNAVTPAQKVEHLEQLLNLLTTSHFEVVAYLGKIGDALQQGNPPRGLL